jgi:hypothetical protein
VPAALVLRMQKAPPEELPVTGKVLPPERGIP